MSTYRITFACLLITIATYANAEYQVDLKLTASQRNVEVEQDINIYYVEDQTAYDHLEDEQNYDTYSFRATIYFNPVYSNRAPYAEAGFLSRTGAVSLRRSQSEITVERHIGPNVHKSEIDIEVNTIAPRIVISDDYFIIEAFYADGERESREGADMKALGIGLGKYINERSAWAFKYLKTEEKFDTYPTDENERYSLEYKNVFPINNNYLSIRTSYSYLDLDNGTHEKELDLAVTFYPSQKLGIGGGLSLMRGSDDLEGEGVFLSADYFVTESLSISATYHIVSEEYKDTIEKDTESSFFGISFRF